MPRVYRGDVVYSEEYQTVGRILVESGLSAEVFLWDEKIQTFFRRNVPYAQMRHATEDEKLDLKAAAKIYNDRKNIKR